MPITPDRRRQPRLDRSRRLAALEELEPRRLLAYRLELQYQTIGEIIEGGPAFRATVRRVVDDPAELAQPLTLPVTFHDRTTAGAAGPEDLDLPTELTIDAGQTEATLEFTAVDDPYPENYEYWSVDVGQGDGNTAVHPDGAILANDIPDVWVTAEQPIAREGDDNEGGGALFVFHRDNSAGELDVYFEADENAEHQYVFEPIALPDDYYARRTIHFEDGQADAPLRAIAVDDAVVESGPVDIYIGLLYPQYGETPYHATGDTAQGYVQDDDFTVSVERSPFFNEA